VWCCVALALVSPVLPGTPPPSPTPLPPSGAASAPASTSSPGQATTPSPVSTQPTASPTSTSTSPSPGQSRGAGALPETAPPQPPAVDPTVSSYDRPVTPPDTDPTRFHFNGRATVGVGFGAGARLDYVKFGDPAGDPASHGYLVESTGFGAMWLRAVGYAERRARKGRPLFFILPDIMLSVHLGGSRSGANDAALANDHRTSRGGAYIGQLGHASFTGGAATTGRVGVYAKGTAGARYLVGGGPQGAYGLFPMGVGFGLRIGPRPDLTVLLGPKIDAVLGWQGIGKTTVDPDTDRLVHAGWTPMLQLAPGLDLVVQARTKRNAYISLLGTADITAVGRDRGGQRLWGRTTVDVAIPMTPGLRLDIFGMYTGWRMTAAPNSTQFTAEGQTWNNHTFLVGVGVGL
jgi:hypothetical protein